MPMHHSGEPARAREAAPFRYLATDGHGAPCWYRDESAQAALARWATLVEARLSASGFDERLAHLRALREGANAGRLGLDRVYQAINAISAPCGVVLWAEWESPAP